MRYGMRLRKSIFIGLMSITLLLSYASVGLAGENSKSGHEGMNHNSESNASQDQTNPEGEQSSGEHGSASGGHGEASGGHGESSGASDEVNWAIVGGFSGINLLVIASAGILKFMKRS